jgi:hypothetical protein
MVFMTKPEAFLEHRAHPRVRVRIPVHCRPLDNPQEMEKLHDQSGVVKDLSLQGLFLKTSRTVEPGEVLRLEIPLKKTGRSLFAFAEVMWVKPGKWFFKNGAGLKLMLMPVEDQEALKAYLDQAAS